MSARILGNQDPARRVATIIALLVSGAALLGCGGADAGPTTAVRGKVTYNGKAINYGSINFLAAGKRPLGGQLKDDGAYEFQLPPGEYQILIDSPPRMPEGLRESDQLPKVERLLPEKFANYNTSGLTATVKKQSEPQTIDFTLP